MAAQNHEITYVYSFIRLLCRFEGYKTYNLKTFKINLKLIKYIDQASNASSAPDLFIYVNIADDGTILYRYEHVLDIIPGLVKVREDMIISKHKEMYNPSIATSEYISYQELKNMLELAIEMPFYQDTVHHMLESSFFIEMETYVKLGQQTAFTGELTNVIFDHVRITENAKFKQIITALPIYMDRFPNESHIIHPDAFPDIKQFVDTFNLIFYGKNMKDKNKRQRTL